jgi:hypothetical protein
MQQATITMGAIDTMSAPTTTIRLNNGTDIPALGLGVYQSPPHETAGDVPGYRRSGPGFAPGAQEASPTR